METKSDIKSPAIELLDLEQVSERYGVSPRSIQTWTKRNEGFPQPIRFSRRIVRWRVADLERFERGEE